MKPRTLNAGPVGDIGGLDGIVAFHGQLSEGLGRADDAGLGERGNRYVVAANRQAVCFMGIIGNVMVERAFDCVDYVDGHCCLRIVGNCQTQFSEGCAEPFAGCGVGESDGTAECESLRSVNRPVHYFRSRHEVFDAGLCGYLRQAASGPPIM